MTLENKIDFAIVISVQLCNPNGDPLNANRPRQDFDGYGEMSDVCLKRKIRDRLQEMGYPIFVQSDDRIDDGCYNLKDRANNCPELYAEIHKKKGFSIEKATAAACEKWIDVRTMGQVFAVKGGDSVSFSVRGPFSIGIARSIAPIEIESLQITKSTNTVETINNIKGSETMGAKHRVRRGAYVAYGSISPNLAVKTGFSEEDANAVHQALINMFDNDASASRPSGSINISRVYWWVHKGNVGQYPPAAVFRTLRFEEQDEYPFYKVVETPLPNLVPEIYDEFSY